MTPDLFVEIFPIKLDAIPPLVAYSVLYEGETLPSPGKLAYRLNKTFPGHWVWVWEEHRIVTDAPPSPAQLEITLDMLRQQIPHLYGHLTAVEEDPRWQPTPAAIATYVALSRARDLDEPIRAELGKHRVRLDQGRVAHDFHQAWWLVDGAPAFSLSLRACLMAEMDLSQYLTLCDHPEAVVGLTVADKSALAMTGPITGISGYLRDKREHLLKLTRREAMQKRLHEAADDEIVVTVRRKDYDYEYPANALDILINPNDEQELQRFGIRPALARRALHLKPEVRSQMVRVASNVMKVANIVENAYNSRSHAHLFQVIDFTPSLLYAQNRVMAYAPQRLAADFARGGVYHRRARFDERPIHIAVINTLDESVSDFVEALRRELERKYGFEIDMLRERKVRVIADKNLESAVRVVEKEAADILLTFLADDAISTADTLKSLTLGRGLASQTVTARTMHDPEAMPLVIMGILAKTGNIPFVLAEPLEYADAVVGLDIVRHAYKDYDRLVGIARIYAPDGYFQHHVLHEVEVDPGEAIPFIVMQTLFPEDRFKNKRVVLHKQGLFTEVELNTLARWGQVINAAFYPVEIVTELLPRLYSLQKGQVAAPPWGTVCRLNDAEVLLMTSLDAPDGTPEPILVRSLAHALAVEQAAYSVFAWTLLHYGTLSAPRLPVTVQYAQEIAQWLKRGQLPAAPGDIPFWL